MSENTCPQCGAPIAQGATECKYCGEPIRQADVQPAQTQPQYQQAPGFQQPPVTPYQQSPYQQPMYNQNSFDGINPAWPIKNKIVAGVLAIFLGGLGIHKFYLGKIGQGILYLLFCWTGIPEFIGFIEGVIYLCSNDHNFQVKHKVRVH